MTMLAMMSVSQAENAMRTPFAVSRAAVKGSYKTTEYAAGEAVRQGAARRAYDLLLLAPCCADAHQDKAGGVHANVQGLS